MSELSGPVDSCPDDDSHGSMGCAEVIAEVWTLLDGECTPQAKERLRQFFITYARGEGAVAERQRATLAPLDVGGFEVADNNHLLLAREMEARERLALAEWSGDAARTQAARRAVDSVTAERQAFEDRVRAQAGTQ